MTEMTAAVFGGPGSLELTTRPVPTIVNDDDVIIRVKAVGICGSDLHAMHTPPTHPGKAGVIFGHEFCGEVVEVGPAVTTVSPGDFVAVDQNPPCGRCEACRNGRPNFCIPLFENPHVDYPWPNTPGFFWDGGMADFTKVPEYFTYRIENDIAPELIVLAEPLGCALNAVEKVGSRAGDRAVVLGGGPIGLLSAMLLKHFGATQVIVVEPAAARREAALKMGADAAIDPIREDLAQTVQRLTGGHGADVVIEAVGNQLDNAVEIAADEARINVIGLNSAYRAGFSPMTLTVKELAISGAFLMRYTMRPALKLIESQELPLQHLVSHVLPLAQVHEGFELANRGEGLKIVFQP